MSVSLSKEEKINDQNYPFSSFCSSSSNSTSDDLLQLLQKQCVQCQEHQRASRTERHGASKLKAQIMILTHGMQTRQVPCASLSLSLSLSTNMLAHLWRNVCSHQKYADQVRDRHENERERERERETRLFLLSSPPAASLPASSTLIPSTRKKEENHDKHQNITLISC